MSEFFHPLRRKIGVATLLLACVFMAGWNRSRAIADAVHTNRVDMLSSRGTILILSSTGQAFHYPAWEAGESVDMDEEIGTDIKWAIRVCGFGYSKDGVPDRCWLFPYWSIVLPLTLLSAWLILTKPKSRAVAKPVTRTA